MPRPTPDQIAAEIRDLEAAARRHDEALADCEQADDDFSRAAASAHRQNARELRETATALRAGADPTELGYTT